MGCCGNRNKITRNYYQEKFTSPTEKKGSKAVKKGAQRDCPVTYEMLLQLFNKLAHSDSPKEEKEQIRYQIAKWIDTIYKECPDEMKYNQILIKIDGTDTSQD